MNPCTSGRTPSLFSALYMPVLLCSAFFAPLFAQIKGSDHIFLAAEHVPANIRAAAIGGAGVAIPDGISCILLNPATLHSFNALNNINITAAVSYGSGEDIFTRHNLSAGAGFCLAENLSFGVMYRYLKPEHETDCNNQVNLNISGRLFERSLDRGVVNLGMNARYEKLSWETESFDTLYTVRTTWENHAVSSQFKSDTSRWDMGSLERRRLTFDLGLYQNDIGEGLDFGVTFYDLIGYTWTHENPTTHSVYWADSLVPTVGSLTDSDTVVTVDSAFYAGETSEYKKWINKYNRRITVGMAFHKEVLQDKAVIYLPFDFEIFSLFDFDTKTHLAFRTGLEVWIKEKYCLRFGYARAPEEYTSDFGDLTNENIFSGGAGARISQFGLDLYIRRNAWGLGGSLYL